MHYDFDTITERRGTNAIKFDLAKRRGKPEDALPLWVADMDFPTAPEILEELHKKVNHGIFGYSACDESFFEAVKKWQKEEHNFDFERREVVTTPGVVFAISCAVRAFSKEGEGVIIQPPVYYPFKNMVEKNGRVVVAEAGDSFKNITDAIVKLTKDAEVIQHNAKDASVRVDKLVHSMDELSKSSEDVSVETESVRAATEDQAASIDEVASASQKLSDLASELTDSAAKFKI
mgnify:CR=1 FL=1